VTEIIKLSVVLTVIFLLVIRGNWKLGYTIFLASLLLGLLYNINLIKIGNIFFLALSDSATLELIGIVILTYIFGGVLSKIENLKNLVDSLQGLIKDYRLTLAFIPALLGLIPMPAGAIFSAPMVKELGDRAGLSPEEETFVNYWFRHIWEFAWPLFPHMILFAGLLKVEIQEVILVQFPLTIVAVIIGFIWEYKNLKKDATLVNKKDILFNLKKLFFGVWPILLIIILVLGPKIDLLFSLAIVILSLIFLNINKFTLKKLKEIIRNDVDLNVVILIASIMFFERMLQVSGGVEIILEAFAKLGTHPYIVLFIIPFFIATMTGVGTASLGIGLPVLLPIIVQGEANLYYAMLAYAGSFVGVMISPMHLCLVITKDYFNADMGKIYKMLKLPLLIVILFAFIISIIKT
jgi:integral membrane protein (TIGR00529 family)